MSQLLQSLVDLYHQMPLLWFIVLLTLIIVTQVFIRKAKKKATGKNVAVLAILATVLGIYGTVFTLIALSIWH